MSSLEQRINAAWYGRPGLLNLLLPLEGLFRVVAALRRRHIVPQPCGAPVIVVGNIAVGGSGKTPAVVAIVEFLQQRGFRPGVVSRGYGAKPDHYPYLVTADSPADEGGDEPCLIARRLGVPVAIDPDRVAAATFLVEELSCDVIVSDDGLQHYRLARNVEVLLVDGQRGFGNGHCLPVGPLREPVARASTVDMTLINGVARADLGVQGFAMTLAGTQLVNLHTGVAQSLTEWGAVGKPVHALAGIGHPPRFFQLLRDQGLEVSEHAFGDHYPYTADDLRFGDNQPLVMTEKDAVKCRGIAPKDAWYLPVSAQLPESFYRELAVRLQRFE
ncbi:tetraacyldisaccharide 4'-kinase [Spongiibacter thalassae]|uniref:tetraacyldisaccharide 4'-kinase n=1 Tax=Spongiibacter thalassae TaxID=2721624 RepID=UPI001B2FFB14